MSSTDSDDGEVDSQEGEHQYETSGPDALFGDYSVLSPGVQIYIDGRAVSAPAQ